MLKQMEGSQAVAEAIALCRPEVICAYPISPQTHIVEGLGEMCKAEELTQCEFINVADHVQVSADFIFNFADHFTGIPFMNALVDKAGR